LSETSWRQGAEGTEARAKREYAIRLRNELHGGLGALIAERTGGERVGSGERIVVQIAVAHRRAEQVRERNRFGSRAGRNHAASGENDRKARGGEQCGGGLERRGITNTLADSQRLGNGWPDPA